MSIDKHITLFDFQKSNDDANLKKTWARGEVIFKKLGTDEVIATLHNKVVIGGSQFVAQKCFDLDEFEAFPTYNEKLGLDERTHKTHLENGHKVVLFACGTNGCGTKDSEVKPVKYTSWIRPLNDLVPFRYPLLENDLSPELREKYYGRKVINDRVAYYFKAFEADPVPYARFTDGTVIDPSTLYDLDTAKDAELFVEMSLRVTKDDFRDYFRATTSINDARINSISLLTAWAQEDAEGIKHYYDVAPLTQLNFPNEPLIDLTKGIDITYHLYF